MPPIQPPSFTQQPKPKQEDMQVDKTGSAKKEQKESDEEDSAQKETKKKAKRGRKPNAKW